MKDIIQTTMHHKEYVAQSEAQHFLGTTSTIEGIVIIFRNLGEGANVTAKVQIE